MPVLITDSPFLLNPKQNWQETFFSSATVAVNQLCKYVCGAMGEFRTVGACVNVFRPNF